MTEEQKHEELREKVANEIFKGANLIGWSTAQRKADVILSLIASSLTPISEEEKLIIVGKWTKKYGITSGLPELVNELLTAQLAHTRRLLGEEK